MKNIIPLILLTIVPLGSCLPDEYKYYNLQKKLFSFDYDRPKNPNQEKLEIIRYVLKNTYENHIHKMRDEAENVVYVHENGSEIVFDKDGNIVTNSYNMGDFNYYSNETEPVKKFTYDTAPWLYWGRTEDDPTTFDERLYYYTLDLDIGIQSYIFDGSNETLETVNFKELDIAEKETYYIFLKILFNEEYLIKLNRENIQRLIDDGEYYFKYFHQIQEMLGVKQ